MTDPYTLLIGKVKGEMIVIGGPVVDNAALDDQFSALVDAGGEMKIGKKAVVVTDLDLLHSRKGVVRHRKDLPSLKAPSR